MTISARNAVLRSLCFHEAWQYAPTRGELIQMVDVGHDTSVTRAEVIDALTMLIAEGSIKEISGRIGFANTIATVFERMQERDILQPRKRRRARLVAQWLVRLAGVRFIALANTAALGASRDEGDLDFFIITRTGTIWSSRLFGALPFRIAGWMPTEENERDAVCLSYFIAESGMDLSSHLLTPDDPYFRYWFLSLLPLYDDGIGAALWERNNALRMRYPFAEQWIPPPDIALKTPLSRLPTRWFEQIARVIQRRWFPRVIRDLMNQDTRVIVSDTALKFHVADARAEYRKKYEEICLKYNVNP